MDRMKLAILGGAVALALPGVALAAPVVLTAELSGANETQGGDPQGSGSFRAEINADTGDLCYTLTDKNVGEATAAHIHKGAAGVDGDHLLPLDITEDGDDLCIAAEPDLLKQIIAAPGDYYVNIHTAAFPKGAVRGQLTLKK